MRPTDPSSWCLFRYYKFPIAGVHGDVPGNSSGTDPSVDRNYILEPCATAFKLVRVACAGRLGQMKSPSLEDFPLNHAVKCRGLMLSVCARVSLSVSVSVCAQVKLACSTSGISCGFCSKQLHVVATPECCWACVRMESCSSFVALPA